MTFERTNRIGYTGGALWRMECGERRAIKPRHLILEPYAMSGRGVVELHAWVEERRTRFHWITEKPARHPKGTPICSDDTLELPHSRRVLKPKHALEYTLIGALAQGHLIGDSAPAAVHSLFWRHFVDDDDGLTYLHKYTSKTNGNFYAQQRLRVYTCPGSADSVYQAVHAVDDAMKHDTVLGERMGQRVVNDANFRDAIVALCMTGEDEETQLDNIRNIVELNATPMDHVIAAIVQATYGDRALLGLRACQRIEHDTEFFVALIELTAPPIAVAERARRVRRFLNLHKSKRTS